MPTRTYLSIGEVLIQVKTEFPDITISKIRFLEAEGLIEPERTPSGYRKFYDEDVRRLRSILRMQRDEYLPLKVIRDRLREEEEQAGGAVAPPTSRTASPYVAELPADPPQGLQMTRDELSSATGVETDAIDALVKGQLICEHGPEGARYFDGDDFLVLSAIRPFLQHGVDLRVLRKHRLFAENVAVDLENIVRSAVPQRNPDAQRAAGTFLREFSEATAKLNAALLRRLLRRLTG